MTMATAPDIRYKRLGEVLTKSDDWINLNPLETYTEVSVRLWGKGVVARGQRMGSEIGGTRRMRVRPRQFILSRIDARNGAFGLVPDELDGAVVSNDFPTFDADPKLLVPEYLGWFSRTRHFMEQCQAVSEGSTNRVRLKEDKFYYIKIPLPPLEEQQRIVEKLEHLMSKIHEARGLRIRSDADAEILLASSLKQIRHSLLDDGYDTTTLGEITTVTAGGTPSREVAHYWGGDVPWIKTGELLDGDIDGAEEFITDAGLANSSAKIFPANTILIALYGQGQTRGRTGRLIIEASTNQACCAVLPCDNLEPRFTQYWLRSLYYEMREQSHGGAQPNWNGKMIKQIKISVPPIKEQRRIITYLDGLQGKVDRLQALQQKTATELDALLPSILDKAFKGEL